MNNNTSDYELRVNEQKRTQHNTIQHTEHTREVDEKDEHKNTNTNAQERVCAIVY